MMKVLAGVFRPVETVTAQGGRAVFHEAMGQVWLKTGARRRAEKGEAGAVVVVETMKAEARADPRLEEGLRLRFWGADWKVLVVDQTLKAGRMVLELERVR